jgi:hypothetical protein
VKLRDTLALSNAKNCRRGEHPCWAATIRDCRGDSSYRQTRLHRAGKRAAASWQENDFKMKFVMLPRQGPNAWIRGLSARTFRSVLHSRQMRPPGARRPPSAFGKICASEFHSGVRRCRPQPEHIGAVTGSAICSSYLEGGAGRGNRTPCPFGQCILSASGLPFRHPGNATSI